MYEFAVDLRQLHLDEGVAGDCERCPIAQRLDEYFGPLYKAEVQHDLVEIWDRQGLHGTRAWLTLSPADDAYEFTHNYDEQFRVEGEHVVFPPPQVVHFFIRQNTRPF